MNLPKKGSFHSIRCGNLLRRAAIAALCAVVSIAAPCFAAGKTLQSYKSISETQRFTAVGSASVNGFANAFLNAANRGGTEKAVLIVSSFGMDAGTYNVSATMVSDGSTVALGTLSVNPPATNGSNNGLGPLPSPSFILRPPWWGQSYGYVVFGTRTGTPFPNGFNPFDIASLTIGDSNNSPLLTAALTPITCGSLVEHSPAVAGSSAPNAKGLAGINATRWQGFIAIDPPVGVAHPLLNGGTAIMGGGGGIVPTGSEYGSLVVNVTGLGAATPYSVSVDGTDVGTFTTGANGGGHFRGVLGGNTPIVFGPIILGNGLGLKGRGQGQALPSGIDLFTVKAVTIHDAAGNVLLTASF